MVLATIDINAPRGALFTDVSTVGTASSSRKYIVECIEIHTHFNVLAVAHLTLLESAKGFRNLDGFDEGGGRGGREGDSWFEVTPSRKTPTE